MQRYTANSLCARALTGHLDWPWNARDPNTKFGNQNHTKSHPHCPTGTLQTAWPSRPFCLAISHNLKIMFVLRLKMQKQTNNLMHPNVNKRMCSRTPQDCWYVCFIAKMPGRFGQWTCINLIALLVNGCTLFFWVITNNQSTPLLHESCISNMSAILVLFVVLSFEPRELTVSVIWWSRKFPTMLSLFVLDIRLIIHLNRASVFIVLGLWTQIASFMCTGAPTWFSVLCANKRFFEFFISLLWSGTEKRLDNVSFTSRETSKSSWCSSFFYALLNNCIPEPVIHANDELFWLVWWATRHAIVSCIFFSLPYHLGTLVPSFTRYHEPNLTSRRDLATLTDLFLSTRQHYNLDSFHPLPGFFNSFIFLDEPCLSNFNLIYRNMMRGLRISRSNQTGATVNQSYMYFEIARLLMNLFKIRTSSKQLLTWY